MAITGKELLEQLQGLSDEELERDIHFAYNYGDHWNTIVASGVSLVDTAKVKYSDYHQMYTVVEEDDECFDPTDPKLRDALIIWS
jgi:hypothetical protein